MTASSQDLHPTSGARFVMTREGDAPQTEAKLYRVDVYLPQGRHAGGRLTWTPEGKALVDLDDAAVAEQDRWILGGVEKLARVLKRDPKARINRWRERPESAGPT